MTTETLLAGTVFAIDKPRQWSSFQVVNKMKGVIRNRYDIKKFKIGHAGTLDPLATGLLLVCVGKATKQIEQLQAGTKVYSGTMVLGASTPCYDLEQAIDKYYPYEHITKEIVEQVAQQFVGEIEQMPPLFSAVKVDGERAYKVARRVGNEADKENEMPKAKTVHIEKFEITQFRAGKTQKEKETFSIAEKDNTHLTEAEDTQKQTEPLTHFYLNPQGEIPEHLPQIDFRITCGKGTYIRSIARDMGKALGSGAFLSSLRRERIGNYSVENALTMELIEEGKLDEGQKY